MLASTGIFRRWIGVFEANESAPERLTEHAQPYHWHFMVEHRFDTRLPYSYVGMLKKCYSDFGILHHEYGSPGQGSRECLTEYLSKRDSTADTLLLDVFDGALGRVFLSPSCDPPCPEKDLVRTSVCFLDMSWAEQQRRRGISKALRRRTG